jgi:hypothetical protein
MAICLMLALAVPAPRALGAEPTLYERIARGTVIVHGRCQESGRRAGVGVVEALRGSVPADRIWVTFRLENLNRLPGSPKVEFVVGTESILIVEAETDEAGRAKGADRYVLVEGARSKIDLPSEGAPALIDAVRRIIAIQALKDQNETWEAHRALLAEKNPHLVRTGFEEVLKFRLGREDLVVPLLGHLSGPSPEFRSLSLRVIGQIFATGRRTGVEIPSSALLASEALARARGDQEAPVRVEAVRALRKLGRSTLVDPLRGIAGSDPSQMVRYEAEVALREVQGDEPRSGPAPPATAPPPPSPDPLPPRLPHCFDTPGDGT